MGKLQILQDVWEPALSRFVANVASSKNRKKIVYEELLMLLGYTNELSHVCQL